MSKPIVYVAGKDSVGWSLDKDRDSLIYLCKRAGLTLTNNPFKATHIFYTWYDGLFHLKNRWLLLLAQVMKKKIIATITNDISQNPEIIKRRDSHLTAYIAPSIKIQDFLSQHTDKKVFVVPFFVNPTVFAQPIQQDLEVYAELGIDPKKVKNKIILGSFQRDSLGANLNMPKWQKDPDLLIEICQKLPKDSYILLLAGPRRHYLIKKCQELSIPYIFVGDPRPIEEMKDDIFINNLPEAKVRLLYGITDIYLVASKSEGGPKQILESCLSKTLVLSTKVGLAPDYIHPDLIFSNSNEAVLSITKYITDPTSYEVHIEQNFRAASKALNPEQLAITYKSIVQETA